MRWLEPWAQYNRLPEHWWQYATVSLGLLLIDPFGSSAATGRYSEQNVARLLAPFYGAMWFHSAEPAPVTVVTIDDATIALARDQRFPLPYSDTYDIVHAVMCGEPVAVFVDLLFRWRHDTTPNALEDLAALLSPATGAEWDPECGKKPPVFVAEHLDQAAAPVGDPAAAADGFTHEVLRRAAVERVPVNWRAAPTSYPLWLEASPAVRWAVDAASPDRLVASPALRLYERHPAARRPSVLRLEDPDRLMTLEWGFFAAPAPGAEPAAAVGWAARWRALLWSLAVDLSDSLAWLVFGVERDAPRSNAFFSHHVSAAAYVGDPFRTLEPDERTPFKGRIVLIGAAYTMAGDLHASPVHGQVPGVFLQAMALDNLFRNGGNVPVSPPRLAWPLAWVDLSTVLTYAVIVLLGLVHSLAVLEGWPRWSEVLLALAALGVITFVFAVLVRWPPVNWIGLLLLFTIAAQWWLRPASTR